MSYQDIPGNVTPGAGAGSGEVIVSATDTTGDFLDSKLTTTGADITKAIVNGGANESINLSLPAVGPGAVTSGTAANPIQTATTDARGRVSSFTLWAARDVPAAWSLTGVRFYLVDYDGGNDANLGYIDSTAGATLVPTGLAVKTFTRLMQIIPLQGNGRTCVVLIKPRAAGATYLDDDAVTQSSVNWTPYSGYKIFLRRGSTDLTNTVSDRLTCGFITALAGPNGNGSFSCLAGGTTTAFSVTGTPFTVEPGIIGMRVRFTGDVTAGLANISTNITINTTSAITVGSAITAPAVDDTFFIEMPGVAVAQWIDNAPGSTGADPILSGSADGIAAVRDVGILAKSATRGSLMFSGAPRWITGCAQDSATAGNVFKISDCPFVTASAAYFDESNTTRTVGFSIRAVCVAATVERVGEFICDSFAHATAAGSALFDRIYSANMLTAGSYLGSATTFTGIGGPPPGASRAVLIGGGTGATTGKLRSVGGFTLSSFTGSLRGIDFATASNGITFSSLGQNGGTIMFDNLTGTVTSNGINCSAAQGTMFIVGTIVACTLAGASNEISCDVASITYATLLLTNVIDRNGNEFIGTAGRIVGTTQRFTASGAVVVGDILRSTGTSGQGAGAQADTLANSPVIGVSLTAGANGTTGYMCPPGGGTPYTLFTGAPTAGNIAYLSTGTIRQAVDVAPVLTGVQKLIRLGRVHRVVGSHAQITFYPDVQPFNQVEQAWIWGEIGDVASTFSATQTGIVYTAAVTANRAVNLEALSTLPVGARRCLADLSTAGAFNLNLTPNGTDKIDGVNAAVALVSGTKGKIIVEKTPTAGWKIL